MRTRMQIREPAKLTGGEGSSREHFHCKFGLKPHNASMVIPPLAAQEALPALPFEPPPLFSDQSLCWHPKPVTEGLRHGERVLPGVIVVTGDVRFGSKADIASRPRHVRFTSNNGHSADEVACSFCANSGRQPLALWLRLRNVRRSTPHFHVALSLAPEGEDLWSDRATPARASSPPRPSSAAMAFLSVARMRSSAVESTALGSR